MLTKDLPMLTCFTQFNRARRYFERLNTDNQFNQNYFEDDIWSFFIHAYSVLDYFISDLNLDYKKCKEHEDIKSDEKFLRLKCEECIRKKYQENCYLRICREVANRQKHCILKRKEFKICSHIEQSKAVSRIDVQIKVNNLTFSNSSVQTQYKYFITNVEGEEYEFIDLAKKIIEAYSKFFHF